MGAGESAVTANCVITQFGQAADREPVSGDIEQDQRHDRRAADSCPKRQTAARHYLPTTGSRSPNFWNATYTTAATAAVYSAERRDIFPFTPLVRVVALGTDRGPGRGIRAATRGWVRRSDGDSPARLPDGYRVGQPSR